MIVTCARCLATYPENDSGITYAHGDWWCTDEAACGDRMTALLEDTDAI